MQDFGTKADNSPPPGGQLSAAEFNNLATENENAVLRSGQSLSGASTTQLAQSVFLHSVKSLSFQDNGTANTYVATPVSGASGVLLPTDYTTLNGAVIMLRAANANTGASTLNIGQTTGTLIGSKPIVDQSGSALVAGAIPASAYIQLKYDSSIGSGSWVLLQVGAGRLIRTSIYTLVSGVAQVSIDGAAFTSTGAGSFSTLPHTARTAYRIIGAGGSGGGAQGTAAGQQSVAAGGGCGGYAEGIFIGPIVGASITIGAGGAAPTAGLTPGNSGGTTSVSGLASAPGGAGGSAGTAVSSFPIVTGGGNGGLATGANLINARGASGGNGLNTALLNVASGAGGNSVVAGGGQSVGTTQNGAPAGGPGAGGSGGVCLTGTAGGRSGGAGGDAYIEFKEYS